MDELSGSFGRLSTNAPEWRPGGAGGGGGGGGPPGGAPRGGAELSQEGVGQRSNLASVVGYEPSAASDLKAIQVKEFVPGQAWSNSGGGADPSLSMGSASYYANQSQQNAVAAALSYEDDNQQLAYDESSSTAQQHQEGAMESTIPAGPIPLPPQHPSSILAPPPFRALHSLGASDDLWRHYRDQAMEACRQMGPGDPRHKAVPPPFCNAYCLDPPGSPSRSSFGYPSNTFQVTSREDGHLYCLRRFDNCRTVSMKIAAAVTDRWTVHPAAEPVLEHPGIVNLGRCFVAQRAVFFVHAFVPGAKTLQERMAASLQQSRHRPNSALLPEPLLWSCLSQLVSAISAVHGAGLAVRSLDVHHVLVTELPSPPIFAGPHAPPDLLSSSAQRWRLYINCAGIADALEFETRRHIFEWQQIDLRALGQLMLSLATFGGLDASTAMLLLGHSGHSASQGLEPNSAAAIEAEAVLARNYSRELHNLIMTLFRSGGGPSPPHRPPGAVVPPPSPSIRDVSRAIWAQTQVEACHAYRDVDRIGAALASEYDSSRVLRLLLKLGFVNERPELGPNRRWAQSGDCYVLSLFRDYGTSLILYSRSTHHRNALLALTATMFGTLCSLLSDQ